MSFELTEEQVKIVEASKTAKVLKIEAFAGAGKTSTLTSVASANAVPSLYLTFNKAMADEAEGKFPDHVECRTIHSMAYSITGRQLRHKLSRPKGRYMNVAGTASEIAKFYKVAPVFVDQSCVLTSTLIGLLIQQTVARFEQSSDTHITKSHVPFRTILEKKSKYPDLNTYQVQDIVFNFAKRLWSDRTNSVSSVLATHDTYLKLYQLTKPKLNYDILYVDESQDVSDVMLDIVLNQDCRKIFVGDSYQSIYQFRGAVNALAKIAAPSLHLSQSFRFGQEVADLANMIINPTVKIKGFKSTEVEDASKLDITTLPEGSCLLFRTNVGAMMTAIDLISKGIDVDMPSNVSGVKTILDSAIALKQGNLDKVKHVLLIPFSSWGEFAEGCKGDPELEHIFKLADKSTEELQDIYDTLQSNNSRKAKYILRTAHGSKGLEWDVVAVMDDFRTDPELYLSNQQEANLLYVATTRAKKKCYYNPLVHDIVDTRNNSKINSAGEGRADMANFELQNQIEQEASGWI